jgi:hypothetical protein
MATANPTTGTISLLDGGGSVNDSLANVNARKLPKQAQEKLRALTRAWSKVGHMRSALFAAQQDARARLTELTVQSDHLRRTIERGDGRIGSEDHRRLADIESDCAACRAEIAELVAETASLSGPLNPEPLAAWLAAAKGKFKTSIPAVALRKNQSAADALKELRGELSDANEEIEAVRRAPLSAKDSIAIATSEIERIAARGAMYAGRCRLTEPSVNGRTRVGEIRWPKSYDDKNQEHNDAFSLLVALQKDQLIAQATAELTALASEDAISLSDRGPRVAELEALVLSLERKEEVLIGMLEAAGEVVSRRSTMNPLAILQLERDPRPLPAVPPLQHVIIYPDVPAAPEPEPDIEMTPAERAAAVKRERLRDRSSRPSVADGSDPNDFG